MTSRRSFLGTLGGFVSAHVIGLDAFGAKSSGPAVVMLMRHGEDLGETKASFKLNTQGMKRAEALPRLFGARLPKPDVIIATRATKGSNRPVETVEPLARALSLQIDTRFRDDDYAVLAGALLTDARYEGKTILVCWHHGKMDNLARALGVKHAPKWPEAQFDHVWVIDFKKSGHASLEDVPQRLLDGDR